MRTCDLQPSDKVTSLLRMTPISIHEMFLEMCPMRGVKVFRHLDQIIRHKSWLLTTRPPLILPGLCSKSFWAVYFPFNHSIPFLP